MSRLATGSGFDNDPAWGALDVAAPEVARVAPAEGTRNVPPKTNVTAAFSEAMDGGTLNGRTFSLRKKGAAEVAARVAYDAATHRAVLNPADALRPGTTYVAAVEAGSGGPRDLAGNALAAEKTWSFKVRR